MKTNKMTAVILLSGGLDSATATALAYERGYRIIGLSVNYGQRHKRELESAKVIANYFNIEEHHIVDVNIASWGGSILTSNTTKELNLHNSNSSIPLTYVPGRNTVFISIGLSLAEAKSAQRLMLGVNAVDYSGYPDCRPDYLEAFQILSNLATRMGRENKGTKLWAPLIRWNKTTIIEEALRLGVPISDTWSCYSGNEDPCGICDSCSIRNKALHEVGRDDLCSIKSKVP